MGAWIRLTFGCLLALYGLLACAADLTLTGSEARIPLAPVIKIYEDRSASASIEDVLRRPFVGNPELLRPGRTRAAIWLKLELTNQTGASLTRWLEIRPSHIREASMFVLDKGRWVDTRAGTGQPFTQWPIAAANATFPIALAAGETRTVYLRIASALPLSIEPTLWDPAVFRLEEHRDYLTDGLMLGSFALMAVVGLTLLFMLGDRAFLFNALATITYFFGELSAKGYGFMYLWPNATEWAIRCLPLYALLGVGLNVLFLRTLLHTPEKFPRIDRLLLALVVTEWVMAPGVLFGDVSAWASLSFPLHFPITVVMVAVGLYAVFQGIKAARYYVVGYAFLAAGSLLHALALNGVAVSPEWGSYGLPAGMLLNNLLLMLAAVEHVMEVRQDKAKAQAALLQAQAAHQAELEKTVELRTADLNSALVETRKTNESQAKLLSYISHDLRAPLSSIVELSGRLSHHQDPEVQRYRATIECSALYQLELIDDLIEYTRGKLDRLEHSPVPTHFQEWLNQVAQQAGLLASQQHNRFVLEAQDIPAVVQIDAERLRQVLINLLVNASKFTTKGVIRLRVHSRPAETEQVRLTFTVDDTGAGISKYDMERIFQPFGRKSPLQGAGLGLAIASQLVATMGGELQAESAQGVGSSFHFSLLIDTADDEAVERAARAAHFSRAIGTGKSLLIADENRASLDYMRKVLATAAFEVTCVDDGEEALRLALETPFAAVIIDQFLPQLDGWGFLRKFRAARPDYHLPIILCSALPPQKPEAFPEDVDFNVTLVKPVPAEALLRILAIQLKTPRPSPVTSTR